MIYSNHIRPLSVKAARTMISRLFEQAYPIHPESWQGNQVGDNPAARMVELMNISMHLSQMPRTMSFLEHDTQGIANLPWAEDHFQERVCGFPINPGTEWANWPDGDSAANFLDANGQFNHNYMERYWPKYAGCTPATRTIYDYAAAEFDSNLRGHYGIRGKWGDLDDLVNLLYNEPLTRQAYLPIFFPEDTGNANPGRKPCTLGYQFILRDEKLHIYYPMRSCDFYRHWGDDVYLTIRLGMWVLASLKQRPGSRWDEVRMGSLTMHCTSLHMFYNDYLRMKK